MLKKTNEKSKKEQSKVRYYNILWYTNIILAYQPNITLEADLFQNHPVYNFIKRVGWDTLVVKIFWSIGSQLRWMILLLAHDSLPPFGNKNSNLLVGQPLLLNRRFFRV